MKKNNHNQLRPGTNLRWPCTIIYVCAKFHAFITKDTIYLSAALPNAASRSALSRDYTARRAATRRECATRRAVPRREMKGGKSYLSGAAFFLHCCVANHNSQKRSRAAKPPPSHA